MIDQGMMRGGSAGQHWIRKWERLNLELTWVQVVFRRSLLSSITILGLFEAIP